MQPCDRKAVEEFDYSKLDPEFAKLSKPAKRALINNRIYGVKELAAWTLRVVGHEALLRSSHPEHRPGRAQTTTGRDAVTLRQRNECPVDC